MAKISARGDQEAARWRRTRESRAGAPFEMVLTQQGRLLYKGARGGSFTLRARKVERARADAQAAVFGMEAA